MRRQEHRVLRAEGDPILKGSKYDWLRNPENMSTKHAKRFQSLQNRSLKTARAWAPSIEMARNLWYDVSPTWARKGWEKWLSWTIHCRLDPGKDAAKTIQKHLWGIINAVILKVSNGPAESINSRIRIVKTRACGFRAYSVIMNGLSTPFISISVDLTYPSECRKSHALTIMGETR